MGTIETALHEAGHAVAYLARGVRVKELRTEGGGRDGSCAADYADAGTRLFAAHAGALAEQLAGFGHAEMSVRDIDVAAESMRALHVTPDDLRPMQLSWSSELGEHLDVIEYLARELRKGWLLSATMLARMAGNIATPMYRFRRMYLADIASLPAIDAQIAKNHHARWLTEMDRRIESCPASLVY